MSREGGMGMLRGAAGKVMWVGRATVFLVGLAIILALVFGAASAALGANGNPFLLGKGNVATKVSSLTNRGLGAALSLNVRPGQPPLAVNSPTKVEGLNADLLDGKSEADFYGADSKVADADELDGIDSGAFLRGPVYSRNTEPLRPDVAVVGCEAGDTLLSGGYRHLSPDYSAVRVWSDQVYGNRYRLEWRFDGQYPFYAQLEVNVTCADSDGDGPGEPVLVAGGPFSQSELERQQNLVAKDDLLNAAAAARSCYEANNGSYAAPNDCHAQALLQADFGFRASPDVTITSTGSGATTWTAFSEHTNSSPVVYEYNSDTGEVRER